MIFKISVKDLAKTFGSGCLVVAVSMEVLEGRAESETSQAPQGSSS